MTHSLSVKEKQKLLDAHGVVNRIISDPQHHTIEIQARSDATCNGKHNSQWVTVTDWGWRKMLAWLGY